MIDIRNITQNNPVIAAVNNEKELEHALKSDCQIVFVLCGDICTIADICNSIKEKNKTPIVHIDLVDGFGNSEIVVDYIHRFTKADGIISTKLKLVKRAKELGMICGLRTFMIDSLAVEMTKKHIQSFKPDFVEILPGTIPSIVTEIVMVTDVPIVVGGLIKTKKDITNAISAGALAVSTSDKKLWLRVVERSKERCTE